MSSDDPLVVHEFLKPWSLRSVVESFKELFVHRYVFLAQGGDKRPERRHSLCVHDVFSRLLPGSGIFGILLSLIPEEGKIGLPLEFHPCNRSNGPDFHRGDRLGDRSIEFPKFDEVLLFGALRGSGLDCLRDDIFEFLS